MHYLLRQAEISAENPYIVIDHSQNGCEMHIFLILTKFGECLIASYYSYLHNINIHPGIKKKLLLRSALASAVEYLFFHI